MREQLLECLVEDEKTIGYQVQNPHLLQEYQHACRAVAGQLAFVAVHQLINQKVNYVDYVITTMRAAELIMFTAGAKGHGGNSR